MFYEGHHEILIAEQLAERVFHNLKRPQIIDLCGGGGENLSILAEAFN